MQHAASLASRVRKAKAEANAEAADLRREARKRKEEAEAGQEDGGDSDNAAAGATKSKSEDPRAAMLAGLLAARGAPAKKKKKKKKKGRKKAPAVPNVATDEDRHTFVRMATTFVEDASPRVAALQALMATAQEAARKLAVFFAEPPATPPTEIFTKLHAFVNDFAKSRTTLHRRKALKERRARHAAGRSPGRSPGSPSGRQRRPSKLGPGAGGIALRHGSPARKQQQQQQQQRTPPPRGVASPAVSKKKKKNGAQRPPLGLKLDLSGAGAAAPEGGAPPAHPAHPQRREGPAGIRRAAGEGYALQEKLGVILQQWGYSGGAIEYLIRAIIRPPLANVRKLMHDPSALRETVEHAYGSYQRRRKASSHE